MAAARLIIVYILLDDMGFGEYGIPALNKIRSGRTTTRPGTVQSPRCSSASSSPLRWKSAAVLLSQCAKNGEK
jgi:hypothetical protein